MSSRTVKSTAATSTNLPAAQPPRRTPLITTCLLAHLLPGPLVTAPPRRKLLCSLPVCPFLCDVLYSQASDNLNIFCRPMPDHSPPASTGSTYTLGRSISPQSDRTGDASGVPTSKSIQMQRFLRQDVFEEATIFGRCSKGPLPMARAGSLVVPPTFTSNGAATAVHTVAMTPPSSSATAEAATSTSSAGSAALGGLPVAAAAAAASPTYNIDEYRRFYMARATDTIQRFEDTRH